jgi:hypothetical protein
VGDEPSPSEVVWSDGATTVRDRWTYHWGARRRPFVHPLRTPAGHVLTVDAPDDHPWHHGLWFTIKFVGGDNYWEEMAPYGVLRHRDDPPVVAALDGETAQLAGWVDWIAPDRETVVIRERRSITDRTLGPDAYALDIEVELHAAHDVVLDRTPFNGDWGGYGGLTLRGRPELVDTSLTLPDRSGVDRLLGEPAPWLAIDGRVGDDEVGVLLIDAPTNPVHPVPWYASTRAATYGAGWSNFVNAAFLWDGPMTLAAGQPLRIEHRVCVHDGRWDPDRCTSEWAAYRAALAS